MIRHELKYQFLHWKWLILPWWLLVTIDLGYQCQWWWDGGEAISPYGRKIWDSHDQFHRSMGNTVRGLLWLALSLAAIGTFLGIAPAKSRSNLRIRPITRRDLFLSRLVWLCLFFGTPWWLHEWIYLATQPDLPLWHCLTGVALRVIQTFFLWLAFGATGWAASNFWQALLIPVVGLGSAWAIIAAIAYFNLDSLAVADSLPPIETPHFWVLPPLFACVTLLPLVALRWKLVSVRAPQIKFWGTIAIGGFVCLLAGGYINLAAPKLVHWLAFDRKAFESVDSQLTVIQRDQQSMLSLSSEETPVARWRLEPSFQNLPESVQPVLHGSGTLTGSDGTEVNFFEPFVQPGAGFLSTSREEVNEVKQLAIEFPDESIFTSYYFSNHSLELIHQLDPRRAESLEATYKGQAELDVDLWRTGKWHELSTDGHPHSFGRWRSARFVMVQRNLQEDLLNWHLRIQFFTPNPTSLRNTVRKRLQFALLHRERRQLALLSHDGALHTQRGSFSAAPYVTMELYASHESLPRDVSEEWFEGTVLMMRESEFIGQSQRELEVGTVTLLQNEEPSGRFNLLRPRLTSQRSLEINLDTAEQPRRFEFDELDLISGSLNQELYELARVDPETSVSVSVSDPVHAHVREAILPYYELLDRFDDVWNENDRDWWLDQIALYAPYDRPSYLISSLAARKGWFDERPDALEEFIKNETPISSVALNAALRLNIPGARKKQFQRNLETLSQPVNRDEFPDIWNETKVGLEESWQKNRWTIQLASVSTRSTEFLNGIRLGRMGNEEVMRAVVSAYLKHGTDHPQRDRHGFDDPWHYLLDSFESSSEIPSTEPETRSAKARKWLKTDWIYLPDTMTYQLQP
ncbi:MAG: hypothetical protein AAGA96_11885 [Verrucomicrobiota bacterium]